MLKLIAYGSVMNPCITLSHGEMLVAQQLAQGLERQTMIDEPSRKGMAQAVRCNGDVTKLAPATQAVTDLMISQRAPGVEPEVVVGYRVSMKEVRL